MARPSRTSVTFTVRPEQFAIWDAGKWRAEPGAIDLMVGSSSADIRGRASFRIAEPVDGAKSAAAIITQTAEERLR